MGVNTFKWFRRLCVQSLSTAFVWPMWKLKCCFSKYCRYVRYRYIIFSVKQAGRQTKNSINVHLTRSSDKACLHFAGQSFYKVNEGSLHKAHLANVCLFSFPLTKASWTVYTPFDCFFFLSSVKHFLTVTAIFCNSLACL